MTDDGPEEGGSIEDQARAWAARLGSDQAGRAEWLGLEAWLAADPAHLLELARIEALAVEPMAATASASAIVTPLRPRRRAPRRAVLPQWAAAAAAIILIVGGASLVGVLETRPIDYQTGRGEIRRIDLTDGTRIDLNGGSRLDVRFDRGARRVRMADAEASFDVTKDPSRPFLITAGAQRIRVVGTAFDVVHHGGELVVTVRRGVVEVARTRVAGAVSDLVRVPAGFQLVRRDGQSDASVLAVKADEAFAWREHRLICRDQTLASIAESLNRAFATPIEVRGAARDLRFSGVLVLDQEDAVLHRLQAFLPVVADRSDGGIVLSSRS